MAPQPNSMSNSFGEFLLQVQKGLIPGHSLVSKFGDNPSIASGTPADIWDYAAEPGYTFSDASPITHISGSNAGDAQVIEVQGLDFTTWKLVNQSIQLNGQNKVALDSPLIRFFRGFNSNGTPLLGNVYIYEDTAIVAGVPTDTTKVRGYISVAENQTLMAIYTIPAGKTGYLLRASSSISKSPTAANAIFTGKIRLFEGIFRTQLRHNLSSTGSSYVELNAGKFAKYPEKTDLLGHAEVSASGTGVSTTFDLLLVDN